MYKRQDFGKPAYRLSAIRTAPFYGCWLGASLLTTEPVSYTHLDVYKRQIELSCDGPLREPYTCYLQGGLNFAASRAGVLLAIQKAYFKAVSYTHLTIRWRASSVWTARARAPVP